MTGGHKDSSGKFHPHGDSSSDKVSSHDGRHRADESVNSHDADKLKESKTGKIINKIKITFDHVDQKHSEHGTANVYDATVTFNGKTETFPFTDSINAHNQGDEPKGKDVLYSVLMDITSPDDMREFAQEYGYDEDSMIHYKIFEAVQKEKKQMNNLFNHTELQELHEEFQDY